MTKTYTVNTGHNKYSYVNGHEQKHVSAQMQMITGLKRKQTKICLKPFLKGQRRFRQSDTKWKTFS